MVKRPPPAKQQLPDFAIIFFLQPFTAVLFSALVFKPVRSEDRAPVLKHRSKSEDSASVFKHRSTSEDHAPVFKRRSKSEDRVPGF
jgi:hypothetical protein